MSLDSRAFLIHDIAAFPFVWLRHDAMHARNPAQWQIEMDDLLERGEPFVIIFEAGEHDETHEDRKTRALWLKRNKQALVGVCLAVIAIEPDTVIRVLREAQSVMAAKAFGIAAKVVACEADALLVARKLLEQARG
jgi:NADPH-dependent ferric siderophore reductase